LAGEYKLVDMRWLLATGATLLGSVGGWYVGALACRGAITLLFHQCVGSRDLMAAGMWLAVAFALLAPVLHVPAALRLHARIEPMGARMARAAMLGAVLGLVPAGLVSVLWSGGRVGSLVSTEYLMLATWSGVLGAAVTMSLVLSLALVRADRNGFEPQEGADIASR